jgi:hypothetical protein
MRPLASSYLSISMEQLGFHDCTDFVKILYPPIFLKSKIQVSLKPEKNKGCSDEDFHAFKVCCLFLLKMRSVPERKFQRKSKYRFYFKTFPNIVLFMICGKILYRLTGQT